MRCGFFLAVSGPGIWPRRAGIISLVYARGRGISVLSCTPGTTRSVIFPLEIVVGQERWRVWDVLQSRLHQVYPQRFAWWSKCQIDHQVKSRTCYFINLVVSRYWRNEGMRRWYLWCMLQCNGVSGFSALLHYFLDLALYPGMSRHHHVMKLGVGGCMSCMSSFLGILWTRDPTLSNRRKED